MITVRIFYKDGHDDIKDCTSVDDICLDGVDHIKVIRSKE
jgi:hypothetical protein